MKEGVRVLAWARVRESLYCGEAKAYLYEVEGIRNECRHAIDIPQLHGSVLNREGVHEATSRIMPHTVRHAFHNLFGVLLAA